MNGNTDKSSIVINTKDAENILQDFTKEEAGEIFMALLAYANRDEEYETDDRSMRTLFRTIQANIDRNNERYEEKCERNRQIALEREKKRKEAREKEKKEEHERTRTYTNVHEKHERTPIEIGIGNEIGINSKEFIEAKASVNKEANASMSELSSDAPSAPRARAENEAKPARKECKIDFEKVRQQFNRVMDKSKIPKLKGKITGQRKAFFEARVRENGIVSVYRVMIKASASAFLNGGGQKGWCASFEWIFRPNNFPKVLDGYYDDTQPETRTVQTINKAYNNGTAKTPTAGYRPTNRNEQRATEQNERLRSYASVAGKWRQIAEGSASTMGDKR